MEGSLVSNKIVSFVTFLCFFFPCFNFCSLSNFAIYLFIYLLIMQPQYFFVNYRDDDKGLAIMSRHRYPIEACRLFERTDYSKLKATLNKPNSTKHDESSELIDDGNNIPDKSKEQTKSKNKKANDGGQSNKATLKTILGEALSYGPALSEHIILDAGLLPNIKLGKDPDSKIGDDTIHLLAEAVSRFEDWLEDIISGKRIPEGYILMQSKTTGKDTKNPQESASSLKVDILLLFKDYIVWMMV